MLGCKVDYLIKLYNNPKKRDSISTFILHTKKQTQNKWSKTTVSNPGPIP